MLKKLASEIDSKPRKDLNSIKYPENRQKSAKQALRGLKREIAIFGGEEGSEMPKKERKVVRKVDFEEYELASRFVHTALDGYPDVKVKGIEDDQRYFRVKLKGFEREIEDCIREFDVRENRNREMDDLHIQKELRIRTAAISLAIANREFIMAIVEDSNIPDQLRNDIEDGLDEMAGLLVGSSMSTRPGPKGAIIEAYEKIVRDMHEGD